MFALSKDTKQLIAIAALIGGAYLIVQAGQGVEQGVQNATENLITVGGVAVIGLGAVLLFL